MGILDSFKNLARPYDENDPYFDDDSVAEDEFPVTEEGTAQAPTPSEPVRQSAPAASSYQSATSPAANPFAQNSRVMNVSTTAQLQVVILKPEHFDNNTATSTVDHLRERRTVVLNLEQTDKDSARRLLDFLSGAAYALDGIVKRIAVNTYLITPQNVGLSGDIVDELENNGLYL